MLNEKERNTDVHDSWVVRHEILGSGAESLKSAIEKGVNLDHLLFFIFNQIQKAIKQGKHPNIGSYFYHALQAQYVLERPIKDKD